MRVFGNLKSVLKWKILLDPFNMLLILIMPLIPMRVAKTFKAIKNFCHARDKVGSSPAIISFSRWVEIQYKILHRASEGFNVSEYVPRRSTKECLTHERSGRTRSVRRRIEVKITRINKKSLGSRRKRFRRSRGERALRYFDTYNDVRVLVSLVCYKTLIFVADTIIK